MTLVLPSINESCCCCMWCTSDERLLSRQWPSRQHLNASWRLHYSNCSWCCVCVCVVTGCWWCFVTTCGGIRFDGQQNCSRIMYKRRKKPFKINVVVVNATVVVVVNTVVVVVSSQVSPWALSNTPMLFPIFKLSIKIRKTCFSLWVFSHHQ